MPARCGTVQLATVLTKWETVPATGLLTDALIVSIGNAVMKIQDCVALITGSNRGLGLAYCEGLLRAGAAKVYAAARDPSKVDIRDSRVVPITLDVTSVADVISAAHRCQDISLLINNAGVLRDSPMLAMESEGAARQEMEANYFGVLSMVQRFAPVLAKNGGGAIVNVLSVASWFTAPFMATYCASKAAEEVLTDAIRMQLRSQRTHVAGVYAGYIDTDMSAHVSQPKTSPGQVVDRTLAGLESGVDRIFADDSAVYVDQKVRTDRAAFDAELLQRWEDLQSQRPHA
jgi:NAD(P)-dependent dehydrogenase (short-subunit alcohol dehydrogenase family)